MAQAGEQPSGSVQSLWRYPVKSMGGEQLQSSAVTERGLVGDRAYGLVDKADGKIATAKNPRKWPQLFEFGAALAANPAPGHPLPPALVTLPDRQTVNSDQLDVDAILSGALNREVHVQAAERGQEEVVESSFPNPWAATSEEYWPDMEGLDFRDTVTDFELPEGTFFDLAVVHVLTTATLDRLRELYPEGEMAVRRFRPNIVIDTGDDASGFVENDWVGRTLSVGDQVQLAITERCPRCVMITLPQQDLPKDTGILRTAALHNKTSVGVYAAVQRGGEIRQGDSVTLGGSLVR